MRRPFTQFEQLEQAIVDYIDYYNIKRIKIKLKGLSELHPKKLDRKNLTLGCF